MNDDLAPVEFLEGMAAAGVVPALVPLGEPCVGVFYGALEIADASLHPGGAAVVACVLTRRMAESSAG